MIEALRQRARLNALIRGFFAERDVLEVETPIMSAAGNTEPNIEGFQTRFSGHVDAGSPQRWLRTSPEYPLKRLLAAGVGDCYELGRVFRNGEAGGRHNPEFTMLEWYRVGWDHHRLIEETIALVQEALALVQRHNIRVAVLKANSPSCGNVLTYDGTFSGVKVSGEGVTAALLKRHGVLVFSELELLEAAQALARLPSPPTF